MTTDGGGWSLVAWNKGTSNGVPADFFAMEQNIANIANRNFTTAAASINAEAFSTSTNTTSAMLKSAAYSVTPLIDNGFGKWDYNVTKCTGNLMHTSRTA